MSPLSKSIFALIATVLVASVILIPNGIDARIQRDLNLELFTFGAMAWLCFRRVDMLAGAFMLIVFVNLFFLGIVREAMFVMVILAGAFLLVSMTYHLWAERTDVLYDIILGFACVNVLWQISQLCGLNLLVTMQHGQASGLMANINDCSALYGLTFPVFMRRNRWPWMIFPAAGLVIAHSLVGMVAVVAILAVYAARRLSLWKMIGAAACLALLIGAFALYEGFSLKNQLDHRGKMWGLSLQIAAEKPWGWGIGQYAFVVPMITSYHGLTDQQRADTFNGVIDKESLRRALHKIWSQDMAGWVTGKNQSASFWVEAHNEYIDILFALGAIGLVSFLAMCGGFLRLGWPLLDQTPFYGLVGAMVTAGVFFTWHIVPLNFISVLYAALIVGESR